jgi:hypothetical protein
MNKILIYTAFWVLSPIILLSQSRHYVNPTATGTNTGTSWADAFTNLHDAIAATQSGDEIWVAQGTYYPATDNNRDTSFSPKSGTRLYGGFSGSETALNQRDWVQYPVVLSGDIGIPGDSTDNSRNIMYLFEPDSNTVVDGFVFRHGQATNATPLSGRGRKMCGGGLYIMGFNGDAYARIAHCAFEYCTAQNFGGGVIVNGGGTGSSVAPVFVECTFKGNRCQGSGGGLARFGGSMVDQLQDLDSCRFVSNQAFTGAGVFYSHINGVDTFAVTNCIFFQNKATNSGGALSINPIRPGAEQFVTRGCIFEENIALTGPVLAFISAVGVYEGNFCFLHCRLINNKVNFPNSSQYKIMVVDVVDGNNGYFEMSNNEINGHNGASIALIQIVAANAELYFMNNQLVDNTVVHLLRCEFDSIFVKNCIFEKKANFSVFLLGKGSWTVENCSFYSTTNNNYSAFSCTGNLHISNSIFSGSNNDGIQVEDDFEARFTNNIFLRSIPDTPQAHSDFFKTGKYYLSNNYFTHLNPAFSPGFVNYIGPHFTDIAPLLNPDGSLSPCSPLINRGNNAVVTTPTDLNGNPRIQGAAVDLGAYESAPLGLAAQPTVVPACVGGTNGSAAITPENACLPLQLQWAGPVTGSGANMTGLAPGNYTLTVTDGKNDTLLLSLEVPVSPAPAANIQTTPVMCGTAIAGSATPVVNGQFPPFQFNWSNGSTDSVAMALVSGAYALTITDARGCTGVGTAQVNRMGSLSVDIQTGEISCYNTADGQIEVQPANGLAPFEWTWATGESTGLLTGLGAGVYSGYLTDSLGCAISWNISFSAPDTLRANATVTSADGPTAPNGSIALAPTGGTGNIAAQWNTGATTLNINGLVPGSYTVTLTDGNGCTRSETIVVDWTVSSTEPWAANVRVFPVPASEQLHWSGLTADRARLIAANGAVIREIRAANALLVSDVPVGWYTLELTSADGVYRARVLVQR